MAEPAAALGHLHSPPVPLPYLAAAGGPSAPAGATRPGLCPPTAMLIVWPKVSGPPGCRTGAPSTVLWLFSAAWTMSSGPAAAFSHSASYPGLSGLAQPLQLVLMVFSIECYPKPLFAYTASSCSGPHLLRSGCSNGSISSFAESSCVPHPCAPSAGGRRLLP